MFPPEKPQTSESTRSALPSFRSGRSCRTRGGSRRCPNLDGNAGFQPPLVPPRWRRYAEITTAAGSRLDSVSGHARWAAIRTASASSGTKSTLNSHAGSGERNCPCVPRPSAWFGKGSPRAPAGSLTNHSRSSVVSMLQIFVAGAERISAVLKHDNWPNAELALCASRRRNP